MEKSSEGRALVEEIAVALTYPIYNATQIWAIATCRSFFGLIKFHWVIDEKEIRIISVLSDLKCIIQTYRHDVKTHKIIATHNSSSVFFFNSASLQMQKKNRYAQQNQFTLYTSWLIEQLFGAYSRESTVNLLQAQAIECELSVASEIKHDILQQCIKKKETT